MVLLALLACHGAAPAPRADAPTWHRDVQPVIAARCVTCHQPDDIAPFPLTTYEEVAELAVLVRAAVAAGTMPPWQPGEGCNDYEGDPTLTRAERETLLAWIDAGTPEGDAADAVAEGQPPPAFVADVALPLPEPYTPRVEPDDYRCQLLPWSVDAPAWLTGFAAEPDQRSIVHHSIAFLIPAARVAEYEALDDADPGPGWTCFGGPGGSLDPEEAGLEALLEILAGGGLGAGPMWIGGWAPGGRGGTFPAGTGLPIHPGDRLVVQMHYNTRSASPVADRSTIALQMRDQVDRPAVIVPFTDPGWITHDDVFGEPMLIEAGDPEVTHETVLGPDAMLWGIARDALGLGSDAPLAVHNVAHHMHNLGIRGRIAVAHPDGDETCLLEHPAWDFAWQGSYSLVDPVVIAPDDGISLSCTWDNSMGNQPIVDGEVAPPADVLWGEGTSDEMCLGILYLTGA